jgi:hypothetical protein
LFDEDTLVPVPLVDGQTTYDLGSVQVAQPQETAVLEPQYALSQSWDGVALTGVSLDREAAAPGDPFLLTLYWQVDEAPTDEALVRLSLVDAGGTAVFTQNLPPVRADFPISQWQAGDRWLGQHLFRLPVALDSGEYQWVLDWCVGGECDASTGETAVLGNLAITAPERLFEAPPLDIKIDSQLGEIATLRGINGIHPSSFILHPSLTLIWQANNETTTSYRVFVHLVDESGQIVVQSDGEPAAWTRPTTGWLPGEIILDAHNLSLENVPAGSYQLHIGLYDPATGVRVALDGGETAPSAGSGQAVILPEVTLP